MITPGAASLEGAGVAEIPCVGAVVFDPVGRLLLVRRGQEPAKGQWSIPGGRVEHGESHERAALRELHEETALVGRVVREVGSVRRAAPTGGTYVIRDFLIEVEDDEAVAGDDAVEVAWFEPADLAALDTSSGLVEALTDWGLLGPMT